LLKNICGILIENYVLCSFELKMQGSREGVKGVTVSRGPGMKKGPGDHENKRKI
jgi:hypothetical protein